MKVVVTGGGSGGHITPILAVAHELKKQEPKTKVIYIGQRGDKLGDIPTEHKSIDRNYTVRAGKFRRYHGEGFWRHVFDVKTLALNIRDAFRTIIGVWQSFWLLKELRPDVIFVKGGFVGVPVGLAAAVLRIPFVTHDSDALPGLANRIIGRWARVHAVALPKEVYTYPADKTATVGVPISHQYHPLTTEERRTYRKQLGLQGFEQIVFVTGGGLGAKRLNDAVLTCAPELLDRYPHLGLVHIAGRDHETELRQHYKQALSPRDQERVVVKGFITNMHQYSGVADVVITRAGASAIAELAVQAKPCIVVPNPVLAGGHQLKNAKVLADRKAIRVVNEEILKEDHRALMPALVELLDHPDKAQALAKKLATIAQPDAAKRLAVLLLEVANERANP
jgi:UDP-N-acetylglucosamine--N-acetylmuramyl-(pentapeptide) pyrophosphoryl-undecaprenol N-acetylglucosamine transferase